MATFPCVLTFKRRGRTVSISYKPTQPLQYDIRAADARRLVVGDTLDEVIESTRPLTLKPLVGVLGATEHVAPTQCPRGRCVVESITPLTATLSCLRLRQVET